MSTQIETLIHRLENIVEISKSLTKTLKFKTDYRKSYEDGMTNLAKELLELLSND